METPYALVLQGKRRVVGTLNLVRHSDFDETIEALTIMRDFVEQPQEPDEKPPLVEGGADAVTALSPSP